MLEGYRRKKHLKKGKLYQNTRKICYLPLFKFIKKTEIKIVREVFNAFLDDAKADAKWASKMPVSSMSLEAKEWFDKWLGERIES